MALLNLHRFLIEMCINNSIEDVCLYYFYVYIRFSGYLVLDLGSTCF